MQPAVENNNPFVNLNDSVMHDGDIVSKQIPMSSKETHKHNRHYSPHRLHRNVINTNTSTTTSTITTNNNQSSHYLSSSSDSNIEQSSVNINNINPFTEPIEEDKKNPFQDSDDTFPKSPQSENNKSTYKQAYQEVRF